MPHPMDSDHGEILARIVSLPTLVRRACEAGLTGVGLAGFVLTAVNDTVAEAPSKLLRSGTD